MTGSAGEEIVLQGRSVVPGVAVGTAAVIEVRHAKVRDAKIAPEEVEDEVRRFEAALQWANDELQETRRKAEDQVGSEIASLFHAHQMILQDDLFAGEVRTLIAAEQVSAESAVVETLNSLRRRFAQIESPYLRDRGQDLEEVKQYVMWGLHEDVLHEISEVNRDSIVVAGELTPSQALRFARLGVAGIALVDGGPNSHTAIVAAALNVPLVVGLNDRHALHANGHRAILDASAGCLIVDPETQTEARYLARSEVLLREDEALAEQSRLPAVTTDGVAVELLANLEFVDETADLRRVGARGIGLYRSEFLYIEKSPELPTEDDHLRLFSRLLSSVRPHRVVVRTFDLGGRKLARDVMDTDEENPSLGLRGIRLTLVRPAILETQLRALFRAAREGELWIMVPMVSSIEEILLFRGFCELTLDRLRAERVDHEPDVKFGAMIEVPSAALIADRLARELDFLSIGTNDLIQYTLAVDRSNEHVAGLYQPSHPAVVELLGRIVKAAELGGAHVSICGEMAADPRWTPLLLGAGLRSLSMSPRAIPAIRRRIRALDAGGCGELYARCLQADSSIEVDALLSTV